METGYNLLFAFLIVFGAVIFISFMFWILCLNCVKFGTIGIAYNYYTGKVSTQKRLGWHFTSPSVKVSYISLLPMKLIIPSMAKVISYKMVKFNPDGIDEFIKLQGVDFTAYDIENILLGYAFSSRRYTFLDIIEEVVVITEEEAITKENVKLKLKAAV